MKKVKKYTGNKDISGVREKIIGLIPKGYLFIEGFGGSAGIAKKVYASGGEVKVIEKNPLQYQVLLNDFISSIVVNDCVVNYLLQYSCIMPRKKVIFLDPPYIHSTRTDVNLYGNFEMNFQEHIALLDYVNSSNNYFIIIHPVSNLYDKKLFCWRWIDVSIRYNRKTSRERIYTNLPGGIELLDYISSIENFTKRQAYKRELSLLINRFQKMAIEKRLHINSVLKSKNLI